MLSDTIAVNGQSIYVEQSGSGPPLLLIMGIGYDSTLWGYMAPQLAERFRVIVMDNRDSGRSSRAGSPYTIVDMAHDAVGVLDELEVERAHVAGTSMGGFIAQEVAIRYPDRVDRLVLMATSVGPARVAADPIALWRFVKDNDPTGAVFATQQLAWLFSTPFLRNAELVQATLEQLGANPNPMDAAAYGRQADAYSQHDAVDRLGAIAAPTLVITGARDLLTPPWLGRELAGLIPGARMEIIDSESASHALPLEEPDAAVDLMVKFLLDA